MPAAVTADIHIRPATRNDADALVAIYRPIVLETATSFELTVPSTSEFGERIAAINAAHAWLLAESDGGVLGYAYATPHKGRPAYRYSVETSVYVQADFHGRGIGTALYERLFEALCTLDYYNAFAAITRPNVASEALHKKTGFELIGIFPSAGFKFNRWHDVSWWHRRIKTGKPLAG